VRHVVEITQQIGVIRGRGGRIEREEVEVLTLDPLNPQFQEAREEYGQDAFSVLFLNDAARRACEMYNIDVEYRAEMEEDQLPQNLGVSLRMDHYFEA